MRSMFCDATFAHEHHYGVTVWAPRPSKTPEHTDLLKDLMKYQVHSSRLQNLATFQLIIKKEDRSRKSMNPGTSWSQ